jgi:transcription initiation factor TFIIIB Brf1 subunit/transcription initiation factor TFIIB
MRRVKGANLPGSSEILWMRMVENLSGKTKVPQHARDWLLHYYHFNRQDVKNLRQREVATALLYIYSKTHMKAHQSLNELCKTVGANPVKTRKYLSKFAWEHNLRSTYRPPEDYVTVISSRMNLSPEIRERGLEIARLYQERAFSCCTPRTIAASAAYLANRENGHRYTQAEIADASGVAEYTVREISAKMRKALRLPTSRTEYRKSSR